MADRQFASRVYVGLKAEFAAFVERNFGPQKVAAGRTRVDQQAISDYGNVKNAKFVPVDVLIDLVNATNPPDISYLQHVAEQVGCLVLPDPRTTSQRFGNASLGRLSGTAMKETADVFQRWGQMIEDGVLAKAEGPYLRKEINEAIAALVMMDLQIQEVLKAGDWVQPGGPRE